MGGAPVANSWKTNLTASLEAAEVNGRGQGQCQDSFSHLWEAVLCPLVPLHLIRATQPQFPLRSGMLPPSRGGFLGPVRLCHPTSKWHLCPEDLLGSTWGRRRMSGRVVPRGPVGDRSGWTSPVPELGGRAFPWLSWVFVGQQGRPRMGRWVLRGVTSSPWVPSSTSGVDPAAVPGVRMGRNRQSRKHLTHPGSG